MKLEAGKTYVFKNEECKQVYFELSYVNSLLVPKYYEEGFSLDKVDSEGYGIIRQEYVISPNEIILFKLKEEPPQESDTLQEGSYVSKEEILSEDMYENVVKAFKEQGFSYCGFSSYETLLKPYHLGVGIHKGEVFNLDKSGMLHRISYEDLLSLNKPSDKEQLNTETSSKGISLPVRLHTFCKENDLFYSFPHKGESFLVDVDDHSYVISSVEDMEKFEKMFNIHKELLEKYNASE